MGKSEYPEKKTISRKLARFVLFRPIKKRSFNLLCVLALFFQNAGSQLCFRFFFKCYDIQWNFCRSICFELRFDFCQPRGPSLDYRLLKLLSVVVVVVLVVVVVVWGVCAFTWVHKVEDTVGTRSNVTLRHTINEEFRDLKTHKINFRVQWSLSFKQYFRR